RVHETGLAFDDKSGDRLRAWLGMDRTTFYDASLIAILPMGFCYPGQEKGADLPPRPECAPLWHDRLLAFLPEVRFTLLVGRYAQARYLGSRAKGTVTETVLAWRAYLPQLMPVPHPSWRNTAWLRRNPWFEREALPALRAKIAALLGTGPP
ncbi:MAG: uracil-DNA glycosylase family protein, partial [Alphaproteobacteria bacterium]